MYSTISFSTFVQGQQIQYLKDVFTICQTYDLEALQLSTQVGSLGNALAQIDASFKQELASTKTTTLKELDEKRDDSISCLNNVSKAFLKSHEEEKAQSAKKIHGIIRKYGGSKVISLDYQQETNVIDSLVKDLLNQADALSSLQQLGLESEATFLKECNAEFYTLWIARSNEDASKKQIPPISALLPLAIEAVEGLEKYINAYAVIQSSDALNQLISQLNQLRDKYNLLRRTNSEEVL